MAGDSLVQLEKGLELLKNLAVELQDDGPQQLWDNVKSCQRELLALQTSLDDRLEEINKALQAASTTSADTADDLQRDLQALDGKLMGAVTTMRDSIATSNDAAAAQERAASKDMAAIRRDLQIMCADLESTQSLVTSLEGDTTVASNHEDVCAKLETLKETTEEQLTQEIARLRETTLERINCIPPPPSLEGCRNDELEGPLKEYADMRMDGTRADLQREIEASASSLRTELADGLGALREEMARESVGL